MAYAVKGPCATNTRCAQDCLNVGPSSQTVGYPWSNIGSQQTRHVEPMLVQCWADVVDGVSVSNLLGHQLHHGTCIAENASLTLVDRVKWCTDLKISHYSVIEGRSHAVCWHVHITPASHSLLPCSRPISEVFDFLRKNCYVFTVNVELDHKKQPNEP